MMNWQDIENERKKKLHRQLNSRTSKITSLEKKKTYWLWQWLKHPWNNLKRFLVLKFPKYFNLGE